jgi:hypothetical protein
MFIAAGILLDVGAPLGAECKGDISLLKELRLFVIVRFYKHVAPSGAKTRQLSLNCGLGTSRSAAGAAIFTYHAHSTAPNAPSGIVRCVTLSLS